METQRSQHGFTLPSVLLASVLMMIMLAAAMQITSASAHALRERYYNQLAREAAESGILRAQACTPGGSKPRWWTDTAKNPLTPGTDCTGVGTGSPKYFTIIDTKPRVGLRYEVGEVIRDTTRGSTGQQSFKVLGYADILRGDTGEEDNGRVYKFSNIGQTRASLSTMHIQMGYYRENYKIYAHTARIDENRNIKAFGDNRHGQLGNGLTGESADPVSFGSIGSVSQVYANRLSSGHATYAITDNGELYAAGKNDMGQLGVGHKNSPVPTPVRALLPPNHQALKVVSTGQNTFVIARDVANNKNVLLSTGKCTQYGTLGRGCDKGSSTRPAEVKVTFEKVKLEDQNGIEVEPYLGAVANSSVEELVADRDSVMVIGSDGNVYAWGGNYRGQIGLTLPGTEYANAIDAPKMITSYLSAGQRVYGVQRGSGDGVVSALNRGGVHAKSLATDGLAFYVLLSNGRVFAAGDNTYGQLGDFGYNFDTKQSFPVANLRLIHHNATHHCFLPSTSVRRPGSNSYATSFGNCHGPGSGSANLRLDFDDADDSVKIISRSGVTDGRCLDAHTGDGGEAGNGGVGFAPCNNSLRQRWQLEAGNYGVLFKAKSDPSYCLAAVENPDPRRSRPRLRPCDEAKREPDPNLKPFYFAVANPTMNEINFHTNKKAISDGNVVRGYQDTNDSVLAISSDNRSVTFIARQSKNGPYKVLSSGYNGGGMLGGGHWVGCRERCSKPVVFQLPGSDSNPVRIYNISLGPSDSDRYNNLYVITDKGNVYGAGSNEFGQLGSRHSAGGAGARAATPLLMDNWRESETGPVMSARPRVIDIAAGGGAAMVFTDNGRVYTVGNNASGQLGGGTIGGYSNVVSPRPNLAPPSEPPFFY